MSQTITYAYCDAAGTLLAQKIRHPDKHFTWCLPDGTPGLKGLKVPLYGLERLQNFDADEPVYLVEGEKDADTLAALGQPALCAPNGAGSVWSDGFYAAFLAGRTVHILPDYDEPGMQYAANARDALVAAGCEVRIIHHWKFWDCPPHGDISDYRAYVGDDDGLLGVLAIMIEDAPVITSLDGGPVNQVVTAPAAGLPVPMPEVLPPAKQLVKSADVVATSVKWLWYPYIPLSKLTLILGEAGSGKTFFALKLAALVSQGKPIFEDCFAGLQGPAPVFFLSGEDGPEDTLKSRLKAMDANEDLIYFLRDNDPNEPLTIASPQLEGWIDAYRPALVILDPIQGFLDRGTDANNMVHIRRAMLTLKALCEKYACTILCIVHPNKDARMKAADRASGSKDFVNIARSLLVIGKDPEDGRGFLMGHAKSNLAPLGESLAFHLEEGAPDGQGILQTGDVVYKGLSPLSSDAIMAGLPARKGRRARPVSAKAEDFLKAYLMAQGGRANPSDIRAAAEKAGISYATIRRAKNTLHIQTSHVSGNDWMWELPEDYIA